MKNSFIPLLMISSLISASFGLVMMNHMDGQGHGQCPFEATGITDCVQVQNSIDFVTSHLNAFSKFSSAVPINSFAISLTLLLALVLAVFIIFNKEFELLKFRSMIKNAEELKASLAVFNERKDGPLFKMKCDPRITKVGRFIRKYRIDELPQFWNIFNGDISLVGPRPHQPDEISRYQKHHKKALAIKAGATGLAQASGSSDLLFEQEGLCGWTLKSLPKQYSKYLPTGQQYKLNL